MKHTKEERVIALAGLFQAAALVSQLAKAKTLNDQAFKSSIESLFDLNPENTFAVYGGKAENIAIGLEQLQQLNKKMRDNDVPRYVIGLLTVIKQLDKDTDMLATIARRLEHIAYQREHFSDNFANTLASLSGLYQETISTLPYRIKVLGDREHLTQPAISDKIRALLFAGVRAAILWRQVGGSKWQLAFGRNDIARISTHLLNSISTSNP